MIKNYLLVILRNLIKNKVFTIINIMGLGLALSVSIVAFFNNMFNYEFNRTHENFEEIYRINSFRDMQDREQEYGTVPATLGLSLKEDIPGIVRSSRLTRSYSPVKEGDDVFPAQISYVDPDFLNIFTFPLVYGDKNSIENHGNILVSRKMAGILFGDEYPVGKNISIVNDNNREFTYTVGAVFEDLPLNSSFRIDILTHFNNNLLMWEKNDADWKFLINAIFIQVHDKSLISSITASLKNYVDVQNKAREDFKINRWILVPLKNLGSNSRTTWNSGLYPSLHPAALISPPIMALFILLIACFNFANTSIATFSGRLKEIALRKTFGGQRKQLVTQFMFETFFICFLALVAGIVLAEFLVPAYSSLWAYMSLELTFTKYSFFWAFIVILLFITGFLAGVYPAMYISSFSVVNVMKGSSALKSSGKLPVFLLAFQFSISVTALVLGLVFMKNAEYQKTRDLGYDRDKLIVMEVPPGINISFRNTILSNPKIISAVSTRDHIGYGASRRPLKDNEKQLEVDFLEVGPEYPAAAGLRLVQGRLFDELREEADRTAGSIIVNQMLVDGFGWDDAIGKSITFHDTLKYTIVGVIKDFYMNGSWTKVEPAALSLALNDNYRIITIRGNTEDLPGILDYVNSEWKILGTNFLFEGRLQEDLMQEEKDINGSIMKVNIFLAIAATLLSIIGMFNMVSLDIIRRTKEFGVRKIQGAPVPVLMYLMSKKYLIVLAVSSVFGCAFGYYLSKMLLDSIWDYFVDIKAGTLILAVTIMLISTVLTIIFKISRTALRNPVITLRYE